MSRSFSRFTGSLTLAILGCLFLSVTVVAQNIYTVGGEGADYVTLEALRTSDVLRFGDTIVLNADDHSLTAPFGTTLTIQGTGKISRDSAFPFFPFFAGENITLDSDSLKFSGFETLGAIRARSAIIDGGTNTFSGNAATNGDGGAIYTQNGITIDGGTNTFSGNAATNGDGGAIYTQNGITINDGTNMFSGNTATGTWYGGRGGAIGGSGVNITGGTNMFSGNMTNNTGGAIGAVAVDIAGGTNTFSGNTAFGGGAIYATTTITGGTNTFSGNTATGSGAGYGGAIDGTVDIIGGTNTFSGNTATTNGGAVIGIVNIVGGESTFTGNTAIGYGGAIYATTTITGGTNTFSDNSAGFGGAINAQYGITINDGANTFSGNTARTGGAIGAFNDINVTGGTNTFTSNVAAFDGGAIHVRHSISINDGANTFSGNIAEMHGGAIWTSNNINITGGTNTFTGNTAGGSGGVIYAFGNGTFRATDGDFTFHGNRDNVNLLGKANAIFMRNDGDHRTLTLAAEGGQNIFLYDPITSNAERQNFTININNQSTDTGRVVFDGSDYTRFVDKHTEVYGNTSVGYGELALKGDVTYGAADNIGSFTLGQHAMLSSDGTTNRIWANQITMNGTVDITNGGSLQLAAANGVHFNGILSIGLGSLETPDLFGDMLFSAFSAFDTPSMSSGMLSVEGNLTFGNGATMSLYWDDFTPMDDWSFVYNMNDFVSATGNVSGWDNLLLDMSAFDAFDGFSWTWNDGILLLSYSDPSTVPEPATLAIIGLGFAGLGLARQRMK